MRPGLKLAINGKPHSPYLLSNKWRTKMKMKELLEQKQCRVGKGDPAMVMLSRDRVEGENVVGRKAGIVS